MGDADVLAGARRLSDPYPRCCSGITDVDLDDLLQAQTAEEEAGQQEIKDLQERLKELKHRERELRTRRVNATGGLHSKLCELHGKPWTWKPEGVQQMMPKPSEQTSRSPVSSPCHSISRKKRKNVPRRLKELKEASTCSMEAAEDRRKQRMVSDNWIFETCPRYTVKGGVLVRPPVWKDMPKGMSSFHRDLIGVVAMSLRYKAQAGLLTCGSFEEWSSRKHLTTQLFSRKDELHAFHKTLCDTRVKEDMKDIFRRASAVAPPSASPPSASPSHGPLSSPNASPRSD